MKPQLYLILLLVFSLVILGCAKKETASPLIWTLTEGNFTKVVLESEKPVLVDFWATWCQPCRTVEPIIDEVAQEYKGRVIVGKVNVDNNRNLTMRYGVSSIPVLFIFKDGKIIQKLVLPRSKEAIAVHLDKLLS